MGGGQAVPQTRVTDLPKLQSLPFPENLCPAVDLFFGVPAKGATGNHQHMQGRGPPGQAREETAKDQTWAVG